MPSPNASSPLTFRPSMRDTLQACTPTSSSTSTSTSTSTETDEHQVRCAYPSKLCRNARAVKLNGDCHNFCEFHRRKANMNQRRWQQRRRRMRSVTTGSDNDEMESAQAVMLLQQGGGRSGRYSPVPSYSWPRYSHSTTPSHEWMPLMHHQQHHHQHPAAPYRPASVNGLESTLPHTAAYTPPSLGRGNMIPPVRSLPLPPLLPSVLAPLKASSPPRNGTTSVYMC